MMFTRVLQGPEGDGGANEPPEPGQELYGLAKAGDEEGVCALLESGMDPNLGGEDGAEATSE